MTDQHVFDDFERRLAAELARHAAPATDPRPTRLVAAEAMRLARRRPWAWPWGRGRLLTVAAVLLLPLAIALAVASALPSPTPAEAYRAVLVRPVGNGFDVSVTEPDGHERQLRHLTGDSLGLGPDFKLDAGHFNASGWLKIYATSTLNQDYHAARTAFLDLAEPPGPPVVLPSNGFLGVRWAPDGRAALVCGPAPDCGKAEGDDHIDPATVRVLDLGTGSETILKGVTLYDGNPEQIWAADGSGFLAGQAGGWGVRQLDGGPTVYGNPALFSRRFRLAPPSVGAADELTDADAVGRQWLGDRLAPAVPVSGTNAADGEAVWMLLDELHGSQHQAVLAKLAGSGLIASVDRFDVPSAVVGFTMSDDDKSVALHLGVEDPWPFVLARVGNGDGSTIGTSPVINGQLFGVVPAATADSWPSD